MIFPSFPVKTALVGKKERKSDCGEWQWSVCVANEGDCGLGTREGTRTGTDCKQTIKTQRCKIPCNWKKKFGGESQLPRTMFFHQSALKRSVNHLRNEMGRTSLLLCNSLAPIP